MKSSVQGAAWAAQVLGLAHLLGVPFLRPFHASARVDLKETLIEGLAAFFFGWV